MIKSRQKIIFWRLKYGVWKQFKNVCLKTCMLQQDVDRKTCFINEKENITMRILKRPNLKGLKYSRILIKQRIQQK